MFATEFYPAWKITSFCLKEEAEEQVKSDNSGKKIKKPFSQYLTPIYNSRYFQKSLIYTDTNIFPIKQNDLHLGIGCKKSADKVPLFPATSTIVLTFEKF